MIRSVLREYGIGWAMNRVLYSAKLKLFCAFPATERLFEKPSPYPSRLDLFSIDVQALSAFLKVLPESERNTLIHSADNACCGVIEGFSSVTLDYGFPIDWQMNPLTGKRCDEKKKWYRLPDFDPERGDIKAIWEVSRFSHFLTLARAYLLTDDRKYYRAFSEQLAQWLQANPYGYGANYKCGQECALRMVSALLAYAVFRQTGAATDADTSNMKDLTDRCYRKIRSNFFYAYRCIRNNHTISELMGTIVGAWCCTDDRELDRAFARLDGVIAEQFTADGGYRQFSFNYQRLALQDLECILSLEARVGRHLTEMSRNRIQKAAELMYQCQDDSGDMPNYGANDGALVFPVTSCGYRCFTPTIHSIYVLLTGQRIYGTGSHEEELIWFSGGKHTNTYPNQKLERHSAQFPLAGLFTIRGTHAWAMVVLNDYSSRPGHLDQLHFDLWIDGQNVLCDSGTYSYASETGRAMAGTGGHNTVKADALEQMATHGPFLVYDWSRRTLGSCGDDCIEGTMRSQKGYTHTRRVEKTDFGFRITDTVTGAAVRAKLLYHTPLTATCDGNTAVLFGDGRTMCRIKGSGPVRAEQASRSLYYLRTEQITCLSMEIGSGNSSTTEIYIF